MYNYVANQIQNFKLYIQPQAVPDTFQGTTLLLRKTIYEQDQIMYNYIVAKIQIFKLQMQYIVNTLHERNLLHLNKLHKRNQTTLQNVKLQRQPQAVHVSDFSFSKVIYQKILVSAYLYPDLDPVQAIARVFSEPSNHDPHTSRLRNQTRFFTPFSCDLEPDITNPTSRKIVISSDMGPDPSAGLGYVGVIAHGFRALFLLNSSCQDFEKVDEGRKMSSALWLRIVGYLNYILSRYAFISSFVSLKKYAGRELKNLIWLRMAGYINCISSRYKFISSLFSLTKYAGRKLNNLMWLRMAGEFVSVYFYGYVLSSQLWLRMAGYLNYILSRYFFIFSFVSLKNYAG